MPEGHKKVRNDKKLKKNMISFYFTTFSRYLAELFRIMLKIKIKIKICAEDSIEELH